MAFYDDGDEPLSSDASAMDAYRSMYEQVMKHGSASAGILAGILLNSYSDRLGKPFNIGQLRRLDAVNRRAVFLYLDFYSRTSGWYPPEGDIEALKARWAEQGWGRTDAES